MDDKLTQIRCSQCGGELPADVFIGMPPGFDGICSTECFFAAASSTKGHS